MYVWAGLICARARTCVCVCVRVCGCTFGMRECTYVRMYVRACERVCMYGARGRTAASCEKEDAGQKLTEVPSLPLCVLRGALGLAGRREERQEGVLRGGHGSGGAR